MAMTWNHSSRTPLSPVDSRYGPVWTTAACVAIAGWSVVAVVESSRAPLVLLVTSLGLLGGLVLAATTRSARPRGRRFLTGAAGTAGCLLVTVGVGHHPGAGLLTVALLAATSPPAIAWFVRRLTP